MNERTNQIIVVGIIVIAVFSILGGLILILNDKGVPDAFIATGSGGLTALATMFSPGAGPTRHADE